MDRIADNIFIGNSSDANNSKLLQENGITAVLNVATDLNRPWYPGVLSIKIGLTDGPCPENRIAILTAVDVLNRILANGYVVFIHCHEGLNRSPFVVSKYLALMNDTDWEVEFEGIKKFRSGVFVKPWMNEI